MLNIVKPEQLINLISSTALDSTGGLHSQQRRAPLRLVCR